MAKTTTHDEKHIPEHHAKHRPATCAIDECFVSFLHACPQQGQWQLCNQIGALATCFNPMFTWCRLPECSAHAKPQQQGTSVRMLQNFHTSVLTPLKKVNTERVVRTLWNKRMNQFVALLSLKPKSPTKAHPLVIHVASLEVRRKQAGAPPCLLTVTLSCCFFLSQQESHSITASMKL